MVEERSVRIASRELAAREGDADVEVEVEVDAWTVMRGTAEALEESETEHASSNRAAAEAAAAPRAALPPAPRGAGGAGLSPAKSNVVHCNAPLERARVGRRNTLVSDAHARRAVCEAQRVHV
jgi:hypothetical protein